MTHDEEVILKEKIAKLSDELSKIRSSFIALTQGYMKLKHEFDELKKKLNPA